MPFTWSNKPVFVAKFLSTLGLGFSLPFVAVWWQL